MSDLIRREDVLAYLEENANNFPDYHEAIEQVLKMPNANKTELEEIEGEIIKTVRMFETSFGDLYSMDNLLFYIKQIIDKHIKKLEEK